MDYKSIINDYEAYDSKMEEIKKEGEYLTTLLRSKNPKERTLKENLDIREHRKNAILLAKQLEEIRQRPMSITQQLADRLHGTGCGKNHMDGCSYYYENSWKLSDHAKYLERATKIVDKIGEAEAKRLLDLYGQQEGLNKEIQRVISLVSEFTG